MTDQPTPTTPTPAPAPASIARRRLPPVSRSFIRGFLLGALAMLVADLAIAMVLLSTATSVFGK